MDEVQSFHQRTRIRIWLGPAPEKIQRSSSEIWHSIDEWPEYEVLLIIQEKLEMLMLQGVSLEPVAAAREGCPPEGAEEV